MRNQVIFNDIATKIREKGYMREYRSQWADWKREKVCKFYRELDSIMGHWPASVPPLLLDTGTTNSSSATENPQGDSNNAEETETNGNK